MTAAKIARGEAIQKFLDNSAGQEQEQEQNDWDEDVNDGEQVFTMSPYREEDYVYSQEDDDLSVGDAQDEIFTQIG
jgi:hypothetical protein